MKLFLLLLLSQVSSSLRHSMKVFFTASSGLPRYPEVVTVIQINDVVTGYCDSELKTVVPKQEWMDNLIAGEPQYWQWYAGECAMHQKFFYEQFQLLKKRLNQTDDGVHIFQRVTSCEWDDKTNEVHGLHQYGFDGEDFISFDLETETWVAPKPQSIMTKHLWDKDKVKNSFCSNFVSQVCVTCLKKNLHYGRKSLLRVELPSVFLLQKSATSPVECHATGFYPDAAMLFWRKDGEEIHEGVVHDEILPNHDGTFQMSVELHMSVVSPFEWQRYECVFQPAGTDDKIVTRLEPATIRTNRVKSSSGTIPIVVASSLIVMLVLVYGAVKLYTTMKACQPTNSSENNVELSTTLNSQPG